MPSRTFSLTRLVCAAAMILAAPSAASAQASSAAGTITSVFLSGTGNYPFRIQLSQAGVDQLSTCAGSFAYLETTQSNYEAYVAALLSRYVQRETIIVFFTKNSSGFCQINEFKM